MRKENFRYILVKRNFNQLLHKAFPTNVIKKNKAAISLFSRFSIHQPFTIFLNIRHPLGRRTEFINPHHLAKDNSQHHRIVYS
jgi:hypothetical protein